MGEVLAQNGKGATDWKGDREWPGGDAVHPDKIEARMSDRSLGRGSKSGESGDGRHLEKMMEELMRRLDQQAQELREIKATMAERPASSGGCASCRCPSRGCCGGRNSAECGPEEIELDDLQVFG